MKKLLKIIFSLFPKLTFSTLYILKSCSLSEKKVKNVSFFAARPYNCPLQDTSNLVLTNAVLDSLRCGSAYSVIWAVAVGLALVLWHGLAPDSKVSRIAGKPRSALAGGLVVLASAQGIKTTAGGLANI